MKRQLEETAQGIENLLNAIQQGILTASTKARLEQLEETKAHLEISMAQAELKKPLLSKKQILFWLHRFRGIDTSNPEHRQRLIDSFVNAVYVYDDKIILTFNYRDGTDTITLKDIEGSDLGGTPPPQGYEKRLVFARKQSDLWSILYKENKKHLEHPNTCRYPSSNEGFRLFHVLTVGTGFLKSKQPKISSACFEKWQKKGLIKIVKMESHIITVSRLQFYGFSGP